MKRLAIAPLYLLTSLSLSRAEDCVAEGPNDLTTNHFFFSASSDSGAVGDAVAVDFSLTLENTDLEVEGVHPNLSGFTLVGCYDPSALELLDAVRYSDFFDDFAFLSFFYPEGGEAARQVGFPGVFSLSTSIRNGAKDRLLSAGQAFPLLTVYFRVTGKPGDEVKVYPCEDKIVGRGCESTKLLYSIAPPSRFFETHSTRHVAGTIRILQGEPTHADPPPLPPNAKIYPEAPTPDSAHIHFDVEGPLVATLGNTLTMRLFATSNYEFSGFMTALTFPSQYLELVSIKEETRPGIVRIDNESGGFGLLMSNSRRRVGQEHDRVQLATLYFKVSEAARDTGQVDIKFEPFENFFNWLAIHHNEGLNAGDLPITTEVTPFLLTNALLKIQTQPAPLGDVNLDYELNLTDAVNLLDFLFRGSSIVCLAAADFNEDRRVNISDSVGILNSLFLGAPKPTGEVTCE